MKKLITLMMVFSLFLIPNIVKAEEIENNAKSALLINTDTNKIIYEKNKDEKLKIASLTKMALQIIVLEEIENKNLKWTDIVTVSKNASDMGGSQIYLSENEKMSVYDLMRGVSIASANDASVALSEYIEGTEEKMTERMNKLVKKLGLKNTHFKNVTGLDEEGEYSTAYDLSVIARELLKHKEILKFSSMYEGYLRENTPNKFWLVNTNKLIRLYSGTDGLKTGHTDEAGYTAALSAKKNNMRMLVILLGEESIDSRTKDAVKLFNYGFTNYKVKCIKKKDKPIKTKNVKNMNKSKIKIYLKDDAKLLLNKSDRSKFKEKIKINKIDNLHKDKKVGKYTIYSNNKEVGSFDLIIKVDYYKLKLIDIILNNIKRIILGKV